jgi:murein endopeptidase
VRWPILVAALGMACQPAAASRAQSEDLDATEDPPAPSAAPPSHQHTSPVRLDPISITPPPHPLADLSDAELVKLLEAHREQLGTASIGLPNRGQLFNAEQAESNELWEVVDPDRSWATPATLAGLRRAIEAVHRQFPHTPPLHLGDLSREKGGWLRPHRSHQSGLDADVSYYYTTEQRWYLKATADNLDRARSWALVRHLVGDPTVEYVFVDVSVQQLLREYAEGIGESREWLDSVFGGMERRTEAPIRHTWGHRTHLHVRFLDPVAQVTAQRVYPLLKARRLVR